MRARRLEFEQEKRKTRRELFLERLDALVPREELEARIEPHNPKARRGRRSYPLAVMLRIHCVQFLAHPQLSAIPPSSHVVGHVVDAVDVVAGRPRLAVFVQAPALDGAVGGQGAGVTPARADLAEAAAGAFIRLVTAATLRRIASILGGDVAELRAAVGITGPDGVVV